jgi:hypothetical protein
MSPFVQILLLTYDLEFLLFFFFFFFMNWEKGRTQHLRWKFVHAMHGIGALEWSLYVLSSSRLYRLFVRM